MLGLNDLVKVQEQTGCVIIPRAIRAIQDQIAGFESCPAIQLVVPDSDDLTKLDIIITPDDGLWKGITYKFGVQIPPSYPEDAPRIRCDDKILHPSISTTGGVCVNVLREEYKSNMTLQGIAHALMFLLLEPSPDSPLNKDAAEMIKFGSFGENVNRTLEGETVNGIKYPRRRE